MLRNIKHAIFHLLILAAWINYNEGSNMYIRYGFSQLLPFRAIHNSAIKCSLIIGLPLWS
jgi:hypothetical protein